MKTKTILELITLSSSLYYIARDTQLLDKINEYSEKGKDNINKILSESELDENGNEMEFIDRIIFKTTELKDEFEAKVEELVVAFYKKVNIVHADQITALKEQLVQSNKDIALLEARLNKLETKM